MSNTPSPTVLTVSQLNGSVRELLEFNYGRIWLRGEISNLSAPSSGHLYFTLKDDGAQVRAAMFKGARVAARLQQPPQNGQQVLVRARVSLYAPRGDYQLIVDHLEDAGRGALQQAFEMLKARLAAEGLFAPERKRPLPASPRGIAVVTSPSGAAVRDILHVLARRAPGLPVSIVPVPVQGTEAPPAIVAALSLLAALHARDFRVMPDARADASPDRDALLAGQDLVERAEQLSATIAPFNVVIVARGGGSLEDLWAFNDESVVRALAAMPVPVVSGIGHEIDFTIADFVVDVRAPTPSAAAELVSPDQQQWREQIGGAGERLQRALLRSLQQHRQRLAALAARLRSPARRLQEQRQHLDELELRMQAAWQRGLRRQRQQLEQLDARVLAQHPARRLRLLQERLDPLRERAARSMARLLDDRRRSLAALAHRAQSVSPLTVISRGYALVSTEDGELVRSVNAAAPGTVIRTRLADGELQSTVTARQAYAGDTPTAGD